MYAGRDGVVEQVISTCPNMFANQKECGGGYGNYITIKHATGVYSRYAHLNSVDVKKGQKVSAGQKIGTATLRYANQDLETVDLLASEDIPINYFIFFIDIINALATSKWFIISIVIVLVLLVVYILLATRYNKIKKIKKRNEISRKYQRRR